MSVTITWAADLLGVSRKHVSAIVNGRVPVAPDMAMRLAAVFAAEPELWVNLQAQDDLWDEQEATTEGEAAAKGGLRESHVVDTAAASQWRA